MLKLDANVFNDTIGRFNREFNQRPLEICDTVAGCLNSLPDSSVKEQCGAACNKYQQTYNTCLEASKQIMDNFKESYDIVEYLNKKLNIDVTTKRDASFTNTKLASERVRL